MKHASLSDKLTLTIEPNSQDNLWGDLNSSLIITEYGDYQCSHCKKASQYLPKLLKKYKDKISLVFRHFPMQSQHEYAFLAAEAAQSAASQGKFWQMHEMIYKNQSKIDRSILFDWAKKINLDMGKFESDMKSHAFADKINADFSSGIKSGVNGTPSLFFNGFRYNGLKNLEELDQVIGQILNHI